MHLSVHLEIDPVVDFEPGEVFCVAVAVTEAIQGAV